MILINLLPHREAARKRRKDMFNASMGLAAMAGVLIIALGFLWFQSQMAIQQTRNATLQAEITKFDLQIKDIAGLEAEIVALGARQQAVEDLQSDRNMPVHLLTELVRQLPEGVYLNNMRQDAQLVTLLGVAQSNERVSELLRNLGSGSIWLTRPDLIEIKAGVVNVSPKDQRRIANFEIRVKVLRPSEIGKAKTDKTQAEKARPDTAVAPVAKPASTPKAK